MIIMIIKKANSFKRKWHTANSQVLVSNCDKYVESCPLNQNERQIICKISNFSLCLFGSNWWP